MERTLAFLLSALQVCNLCTAAPVPAELSKMKFKVKCMAEQLVVRLDRDFEFPPGLTPSPPADDLDGLSGTMLALDGYNDLISDTFGEVAQVKYEISSLTGYMHQWRRVHCGEGWTETSEPRPLQELQSQKQFIHTVGLEALLRVRESLHLLLRNPDQLETC